MTTLYVGFNDTHLTEKLREQHGLTLSRESVRRVRQQLGQPPQRARRAPQARRRRVPEAARGALIQIDGSPFAWLEARGPELVLLGAVDDATTEILALQFRPTEDVHGYACLFRDVFTRHGLPLAVYGDRLNLLVRNDAHWSVEEQLAGSQAPTHLGRILHALAVGYIGARSPQAKGRIERLWATLQDRLVSELRLRDIRTVEAAQAYLPEFIADFNRRFGKPPAQPHAVWRRPPRDLALLPRLPLSPRRRARQHHPARSAARAAARATFLRRAHRRSSRAARWPGRRPSRGGYPRRDARARPHVHPQAAPRARRGSPRPPPRPAPAAAPALATPRPQHAHWPPAAPYSSLRAAHRPRHPASPTTNGEDLFTSQ